MTSSNRHFCSDGVGVVFPCYQAASARTEGDERISIRMLATIIHEQNHTKV